MTILTRNIEKIILILLCWIPFFIYIYHNSSAIPFNDDYDLFLQSLIRVKEANGITDVIGVIFSQHMEHRPAFPRVIAFFVWKIVGNCDFKILTLIGNCMLFLTWLVLNHTTVGLKFIHRFCFSLLTFFILASFQSMENLIWATGSLQNYSFVFFATCSMYCVSRHKNVLAIICWVFSITCAITGFVLIPILFLMILRQSKISVLIAFTLIVIITCIGYFYKIDFPPVEKLPGIIPQRTPIAKLKYFLVFMGSCFTLGKNTVGQALFWGVIIAGIIVVFNWKISSWDFWTYLSIFVVLVALSGVAFRSVLGPEQALSERYRVYSELALIATIYKIFIVRPYFRKWIGILLCLITIQFILIRNYFYPRMIDRKKNLDNGFHALTVDKNPFLLTYPNSVEGAAKMIRAYELGIYKAP